MEPSTEVQIHINNLLEDELEVRFGNIYIIPNAYNIRLFLRNYRESASRN